MARAVLAAASGVRPGADLRAGRAGGVDAAPPWRPPAARRIRPRVRSRRRRRAGAGAAPPDRGPRVVSLGRAPGRCRITGVVLANELLDNLAFGLLERTEAGVVRGVRRRWSPTPESASRGLVEVLLPGIRARQPDGRPPGARRGRRRADPDPAPGRRRGWPSALSRRRARPRRRDRLRRPRPRDWRRGRRPSGCAPTGATQRGGAPADATRPPGHHLRGGHRPARRGPRAGSHDDPGRLPRRATASTTLVEEGRRVWRERAAVGDLEAVRARSRVGESEALLDPSGLGAFTVLRVGARVRRGPIRPAASVDRRAARRT